MTEYRIGRGWSEKELVERLKRIKTLPLNFSDPPERLASSNSWNTTSSEAVVAREPSGPPVEDGAFARGRLVVSNFGFSDPRIVIGHFDPHAPLLGRCMLLEMRALRVLHYLGGVAVGAVRSEEKDGRTVFGFRYDTLEGHIEKGAEWFLLTKDHSSGDIRFQIEASWRPGHFPNRWSRLGFSLLGSHYQEKWHRRAHAILSRLMRDPALSPPEPGESRLIHMNPKVEFKRTRVPTAAHPPPHPESSPPAAET